MGKTTWLTSTVLTGGALCFWTAWVLMPGVGVTDSETILTLVSAQPERVLISSVLQLLSAACFALAIPGLAQRFPVKRNSAISAGIAFLAVGACGVAADAVYHQLAYEMTRPRIDQRAMLPVMQRMQTVDLLFLVPMILSFLVGCLFLAIGAAKERIVSRWNPLLYVVAAVLAPTGTLLGTSMGVEPRIVGLACLGFLSASVGWIGIAICKARS